MIHFYRSKKMKTKKTIEKFKDIKLISFDLDGTLVDKTKFDDVFWMEEVPRIYAKEHSISLKEAKRYVTSKYFESPQNSPDWYRPKHWFKSLGLDEDHNRILNDMKHRIKVFKDVMPALREISKKHRMIIITHSVREMTQLKVECEGLKDFFERIYSSTDDFEMTKKDEKIFRIVLKKHKLRPEQLLHIGDSREFDFEVPRGLGINALFLDRKRHSRKQFVIKSLKEITKYLR